MFTNVHSDNDGFGDGYAQHHLRVSVTDAMQ